MIGIHDPETRSDVTVIISTFNGSAYLQQQLDSLYAQTHPNIRIMVRDDGSSDTTRRILESEQSQERLELLTGHDNLGPSRSFFELLRKAAATKTDFIAFCDQDDVWLPEKLSQAVTDLSAVRNERAAMYCSKLEIVDADLVHIGFTFVPKKLGFGNALVENVCTGCTIVLNRKAIDLICQNLPTRALAHDWWCYLVLSCFGEIIFDQDAHIKYRQHGNNVVGVPKGNLDRLKKNVRRYAGSGEGRQWRSEQASAFIATFGDGIPISERRVLNRFVQARSSWPRRLELALSNDIWRQKRIDNLVWRFLVLINRF